jgi:4-hydroxy-tetrahydrodipicolinate reductase
MKALIVGPGKMGRAVEAALISRGHAVARKVGPRDRIDAIEPATVDVAFEFTTPEAATGLVRELLLAGIPTVSGTTGWDVVGARDLARERRVPFLHAPNFSIGVAVLRRAVAQVARDLARFTDFQPGIVDRHHAAKKDAPSGTARALAAEITAVWGPDAGEVPIVSLRHGGQPGEHAVVFEGPEESIELVHRARSRAIFAGGAVQAAEWLLRSGLTGPVTLDDFFERRTL